MTTIDLSAPPLFYQNPINILQTNNGISQYDQSPISFSCRGCNLNLTSSDPASQYQRQKIIQNTVRVYASLYSMNLAGLSAYTKPLNRYQSIEQNGMFYLAPPGVNWNQMSDRPVPSVQVVKTGSGSAYGASSTRHTIVRNRPGAMSPGGVGVDIKHNSYDRYLNRIKGKGPLRRGPIPRTFGQPIPFNRADPIYGGKTVKTSIINDCDCPILTNNNNNIADNRIYGEKVNALQDEILAVHYTFNVGDYVWALSNVNGTKFSKAQIVSIDGNNVVIQFTDGSLMSTTIDKISIYFECNCNPADTMSALDLYLYFIEKGNYNIPQSANICRLLNLVAISPIL
jgi:hypothetical protein